MTMRTSTVKMSGSRFRRLSVQSARNSVEWFFFIIIARRKWAMSRIVTSPVRRLTIDNSNLKMVSFSGMICAKNGLTKVNIKAMVALVRIE